MFWNKHATWFYEDISFELNNNDLLYNIIGGFQMCVHV